MNTVDTLIQRELRLPHVRYCDDLLIFADEKSLLHAALVAVRDKTATLRLTLHPVKTRIYCAEEGVDFVGYRLFRGHRRLRRSNVRLFVRRLRRQQTAYRTGQLPADRLRASIRSWIAHAQHADTYHLRSRLLRTHPFAPPEHNL